MSNKQNIGRDPEKRAAKRRAQREAQARGAQINPREPGDMSRSQTNHGASPKGRKWAAEGEKKMRRGEL